MLTGSERGVTRTRQKIALQRRYHLDLELSRLDEGGDDTLVNNCPHRIRSNSKEVSPYDARSSQSMSSSNGTAKYPSSPDSLGVGSPSVCSEAAHSTIDCFRCLLFLRNILITPFHYRDNSQPSIPSRSVILTRFGLHTSPPFTVLAGRGGISRPRFPERDMLMGVPKRS